MNEVEKGMMKYIRQWHGTTDEKMENINNLTDLILDHALWKIPENMKKELKDCRLRLKELVTKCHTADGSTSDRARRNTLLKHTVGFCLVKIKGWAIGQHAIDELTAHDVHLMGFLLPGETGGRHDRAEMTHARPEVKVSVINEDLIRVVIDQSSGENAALVTHGWPAGVRHALIVITGAADGKEAYRRMTTRLHNDVFLTAAHGKQFIIKAAFLRHIDDEPVFGNQLAFSMPLTTEDLVAALERQHEADAREHARETERHRQEMDALLKKLEARK
ncbi:MAG: hypothetical protein LBJ60_05395 [Tannerellaceae bacterium]|jgi:hypothetical protein|nr:hypothetical protein [Tannerellaceae bacterium]